MTKDDIELLTTAVKASVRKTPIRVYDSDGLPISLYKEDVIDICPSNNVNQKLVYIILADGTHATYLNKDNSVKTFDVIKVLGTPKQWRKLFDFNPICLNPLDDE